MYKCFKIELGTHHSLNVSLELKPVTNVARQKNTLNT